MPKVIIAYQATLGYLILSETACEAADIAIALDASGSIELRDPQGWQKQKDFTKALVYSFDINQNKVRFAIITFSHEAKIFYTFNQAQNKDSIKNAVDGLVYIDATTNTPDAIDKMYQEVFTVGRNNGAAVPKIGIIVTDGVANVQGEELDHVLAMVSSTYSHPFMSKGCSEIVIWIYDTFENNLSGETYCFWQSSCPGLSAKYPKNCPTKSFQIFRDFLLMALA